jgi:hypothetical protein
MIGQDGDEGYFVNMKDTKDSDICEWIGRNRFTLNEERS